MPIPRRGACAIVPTPSEPPAVRHGSASIEPERARRTERRTHSIVRDLLGARALRRAQPAALPSCAIGNVQVWSIVPSLPSSTVSTTRPLATVVAMVAAGRITVQAPDTSAPVAS